MTAAELAHLRRLPRLRSLTLTGREEDEDEDEEVEGRRNMLEGFPEALLALRGLTSLTVFSSGGCGWVGG